MTEITDQWEELVKSAGEIGAQHGTNAAAWWEQENLGGRAPGEVKASARRVLRLLDDCDTDALGLPGDGMAGEHADDYAPRDLCTELGIAEDGDDDSGSLVTCYQDAFSSAVESAVSQHAHSIVDDA